MKTILLNTIVFKNLHYLYRCILKSNIFNIQRGKFLFKPDKNKRVHISYDNDMSIDHEKHYHRPNTRPVVEKQTLIQEKKKQKKSQ